MQHQLFCSSETSARLCLPSAGIQGMHQPKPHVKLLLYMFDTLQTIGKRQSVKLKCNSTFSCIHSAFFAFHSSESERKGQGQIRRLYKLIFNMVGTELEWSPRGWSSELGKNLSRNRTGDVAQWVKCVPNVLERLDLILSL